MTPEKFAREKYREARDTARAEAQSILNVINAHPEDARADWELIGRLRFLARELTTLANRLRRERHETRP